MVYGFPICHGSTLQYEANNSVLNIVDFVTDWQECCFYCWFYIRLFLRSVLTAFDTFAFQEHLRSVCQYPLKVNSLKEFLNSIQLISLQQIDVFTVMGLWNFKHFICPYIIRYFIIIFNENEKVSMKYFHITDIFKSQYLFFIAVYLKCLLLIIFSIFSQKNITEVFCLFSFQAYNKQSGLSSHLLWFYCYCVE